MSLQFVVADSEAWAAAAVARIERVLTAQPAACVGFPTGRTPQPLYGELRRRAGAARRKYSELRAVMLDEYLDAEARFQSWTWLKMEVFDPLRIDGRRIRRMPQRSAGIGAACGQFERALQESGGCDLQLLGLGANGHIGFNEPGSAAGTRTRAVTLTEATAGANAAYWQGAFTPRRAATMGIATILQAREIGLLVRGVAKAGILRRALSGEISAECPASFLRTASAPVWVLADREAACRLDPKVLGTLGYNVPWP